MGAEAGSPERHKFLLVGESHVGDLPNNRRPLLHHFGIQIIVAIALKEFPKVVETMIILAAAKGRFMRRCNSDNPA